MYIELSRPLSKTRSLLRFKATPDVVNVLVVAVSLVVVPDAVRFVNH